MRSASFRTLPLGISFLALIGMIFFQGASPGNKSSAVELPDGSLLRDVEEISKDGNVLIRRERGQYQISYVKKYDEFIITLFGADANAAQQTAEAAFVKFVSNGSKKQACEKNVRLVPSADVHPSLRGAELGLSFCAS